MLNLIIFIYFYVVTFFCLFLAKKKTFSLHEDHKDLNDLSCLFEMTNR